MNDAPSPDLIAMLRNQVFEEILETADLAASYSRSIAEAAFRGDELTMATHLKQLRLCVIDMLTKHKIMREGDVTRQARVG